MNEENVIVTEISIERDNDISSPKVVLRLEGFYCTILTFQLKKIEELLNLFEVNSIKNIKCKACRIIIEDKHTVSGIRHFWKEDKVMAC